MDKTEEKPGYVTDSSFLESNVKERKITNNVTIRSTAALFEEETMELETSILEAPKMEYKTQIVWKNVIWYTYLHLSAIYGLYLAFTSAKWITLFFAYILLNVSFLGITAAAHRLWTHKSYKAKWPLQILLMVFNCLSSQNSVIEWARDHRMHHKYSETNADPHNVKRGFFFAHIGWLLCRKHPDVKIKGKEIDLSDLYNYSILRFQKKYYKPLMYTFCFILPTIIPVYFWNETWKNAYYVATILRYASSLNAIWLVNSVAHLYGNKPYDRFINPVENKIVSMSTLGEGWHNYHHVFPWDYKAAELGNYRYNFTTAFIDFFAWLGWAYDLKQVSPKLVKKRVKKTGDGGHSVWGLGDKDQTQ